MCVNYNDPDELVITTDGDPGHKVKIMKSGDTLSKDKFKGATKSLGFTGSGHTVSPWSDSGPWKPGTYTFEGKDADGNEMSTTATLSNCVADAPEIVTIATIPVADIEDKTGKCVFGGIFNEIIWTEVSDEASCDVDHYVVSVECEGSPPFSEQVEPDGDELDAGGAESDEFELAVPDKFWGDGDGTEKECTVKVMAVMDNCNTIMSDPVTFVTCETEAP
jgi:hypothetical protein